MDLNATWFVLFTFLIIGYSILDGFDLGVGVLHLFAKGERAKRIQLNAIGPVWDGNEVWLITAGAALFAAFPVVYATLFSGFYIAFMLLLLVMIGRAVSLEFRSKVESSTWRRVWDNVFGIGSLVIIILFGVAAGNIIRGVPIDADGLYRGSFIQLLNPYAIIVALVTVSLFTMHGALYMVMKTDGDLRRRYRSFASNAWIVFLILWAAGTVYSLFSTGHLFADIFSRAAFWIFAVLFLVSLLLVRLLNTGDRAFPAFLASSTLVAALLGLVATGMFPELAHSSIDPDFSLTAYNASSTPLTLETMLWITGIGMPLVILYQGIIYRIFKGKVIVPDDGY